MNNVVPIRIQKERLTQYVFTTSWTNVPGLAITVPRDDYYNIVASFNNKCFDAGGLTATGWNRFAVDGSRIGIEARIFHSTSVVGAAMRKPILLNMAAVYLKKGQIVTSQVKGNGGDNLELAQESLGVSWLYIEAFQ